MKKYFTLFIISILFIKYANSQDNIGVHFPFLTYHPGGDKMAFLQPNRLDDHAVFVINWGAIAHYERFIYKQRLSIKVVQAAYSDCAELFAGHTHLALRWNIINTPKHSLRFGFGPTFVYRKSWYRFPGYEQQTRYLKTKGDWQYVYTSIGGEIEYDYLLNERMSINAHLIPGVPDFFLLGFGFRYWIRPVPLTREWKKNPHWKKWFYTQKDLQ